MGDVRPRRRHRSDPIIGLAAEDHTKRRGLEDILAVLSADG